MIRLDARKTVTESTTFPALPKKVIMEHESFSQETSNVGFADHSALKTVKTSG